MYQLVTTVRETEDGYHVSARLSEVLLEGGVAPLGSREAVYPFSPNRSISDPFVGILQMLGVFARDTLVISGHQVPPALF